MAIKQPRVQIDDPVEALVTAFNERTNVIQKEATDLHTAYETKLAELKNSFDKSARNSEKVMTAVIAVLALGFISLLVALIAIVTSAWQAKSQSDADAKQAPNISKMLEQQQKILDNQKTASTSTNQQPTNPTQ